VRNPTGVPDVTQDSKEAAFMTLAQFLKSRGVAQTGGQAKVLIREGGITVNGEPEARPGRKLHNGDVVVFQGQTINVDSVRES
jgi:ribosome-associated protein